MNHESSLKEGDVGDNNELEFVRASRELQANPRENKKGLAQLPRQIVVVQLYTVTI